MEIRPRTVPLPIEASLRAAGVHPLLARLYAARGVRMPADVEYGINALLPPHALKGIDQAARLLADAIARESRMLIVADYDCDGATACAVGLRALRAFGARVDYFVPNRQELGYGLTRELVEVVAARKPDLLITVDNGIASIDGVAAANERGIRTLITDHHLPADTLPAATCIVNPNQPGCAFPSKSIAGVGVLFYVMIALRSVLRERGHFKTRAEPNLAHLLDLVAAGTVADVVRLDHNNRVMVSQGLQRIRSGKACAGLQALFAVAGREVSRASGFDLGFAVGPRINAAGRLADMHLGIECLATDDMSRALSIAQDLDRLNRERRDIEASMQAEADIALDRVQPSEQTTLSLFDPSWHQGVVGILAGRIKDRFHRPTFVFAPGGNDQLRGSGRSIAGLHLRDCLDLVSKMHPNLLIRFGGHAAAAGVTIAARDLDQFSEAFETVSRKLLDASALERIVEIDGSLEPQWVSLEVARLIDGGIWGQGFPAPLFADQFSVRSQRVVGGKHLRLKLERDGYAIDAIQFNQVDPLPATAKCVYRLTINQFNGLSEAQLTVEHWSAAA
ncbi:MAG: single-stranded-DNA-specific exonuclease RecJ [Burkholderiales bacterium]